MKVELDLDRFLEQLNILTDIADDFHSGQENMQTVMSDHWTALGELNRFESPQNAVLDDLAVAFNSIRTSFDNLAVDLRNTFERFVESDEVSAEDLRKITSELDDLDRAIEGIDDVVNTGGGAGGGLYYTIA